MQDPLSQFRRNAPASSKAGPVPPEDNEYVAFGTKDRCIRLRVRPRGEAVNSIAYTILLNVVYSDDGSFCILIFTIATVLVQGRNLQQMVFAIENGLADFIAAYDSKKWLKPKDADAAFIDHIEIKVAESGSAALDKRR